MLFLADFSVIKPDFGLLFWTSIFFLLFWLLIGKFAFKPIAESLKKRTSDIQDALDEFDGDYDEEELRLMRIKFINEVAN